jgi:hypothetical protein
MRTETKRDVIATWFVADTPETASSFPQSGHNSASASFQDIYWRCVACFFATASRQAPHAKFVFYTNTAHIPTVGGTDLRAFLSGLDVEIRTLPIEHRLGKDKVSTWGNQFYILDILEDLARRDDFDTVCVLDSDCVWVRPIGSMLADIERRGILSLSIPYMEEFNNNGATRYDMQRAAALLTGREMTWVPHYSGGEIFAATRAAVDEVLSLSRPMWAKLSQSGRGEIPVNEEGQFLSILYELIDVPVGTADPHCKRMWTALNLYSVSNEDIYSSRCIWHLPMEKKTGFRDLYTVVCQPSSWFWTMPKDHLFKKIAAIMGIPKRSLRQTSMHVVARLRFYLDGYLGTRTSILKGK